MYVSRHKEDANVIKHLLKTYITDFILSDKRQAWQRQQKEKSRQKAGMPHTLEVFLALDDPLSYLLLQVLPDIRQRYQATLVFKMVLKKQANMFPEVELWNLNVLNDAVSLSRLYQLKAPTNPLNTNILRFAGTYKLLSFAHQEEFLNRALPIFEAYWQNNDTHLQELISPDITLDVQMYESKLKENEAYLIKQGHYLSASILYGGEWYWGLERLQYLEHRLNALIFKKPAEIKFDKLHQLYQPYTEGRFVKLNVHKTPLTIYFSVRSPYSYIGLVRAVKLAKHYNIPLQLKPVLPMLMRGLPVPRKKSLYIVLDVKREAQSYGIDFGKIADPLGSGVERCYALFNFAQSQGKGTEFMLAFTRSVWAGRVRSETDSGMKKIVEIAGLNWQQAKAHIHDESWRDWAKDNLSEMYALGLWGVPSFQYKNTVAFGQDKLLFIEEAIINSLNAHTGITV